MYTSTKGVQDYARLKGEGSVLGNNSHNPLVDFAIPGDHRAICVYVSEKKKKKSETMDKYLDLAGELTTKNKAQRWRLYQL